MGSGAEPLVRGSEGKALLKLIAFSWMYVPRFRQISPFLMFGVKRRKMIFKHRQTTNIRAVMLFLALVLVVDSSITIIWTFLLSPTSNLQLQESKTAG